MGIDGDGDGDVGMEYYEYHEYHVRFETAKES
jgi:hypothetical protein